MAFSPLNNLLISVEKQGPGKIKKDTFPLRYGKYSEIKTSEYEFRFNLSGQYWFEFYGYGYHEAGEIFYVVGRERGEYRAGETVLNMAIRTTRIFRQIDGEWRQVHHHGSIDDPGLLAAYQKAVK